MSTEVSKNSFTHKLARALVTAAIDQVGNGRAGRLSLVDPDAVLLLELSPRTHGSQRDVLAFTVELQGVARPEVQLLAQRFRDENSPGTIESYLGNHWESNVGKPIRKPTIARLCNPMSSNDSLIPFEL